MGGWKNFVNTYVTGNPFNPNDSNRKNKEQQAYLDAQNKANQSAQDKQNAFIRQQNKEDKDFLKYQMQNNMLDTAGQYRQLGINPLALAGQTGSVTALQGTPQGAIPDQVAQKFGVGDNITGAVGMATQMANLKLLTNQMESIQLDNQYKQYQMEQIGVKTTSTSTHASSNGFEGGSIATKGVARVDNETFTIVPSSEMKQRMEDDRIQEWLYHQKNTLPYALSSDEIKGLDLPPAKKGFVWWQDGLTIKQEPKYYVDKILSDRKNQKDREDKNVKSAVKSAEQRVKNTGRLY